MPKKVTGVNEQNEKSTYRMDRDWMRRHLAAIGEDYESLARVVGVKKVIASRIALGTRHLRIEELPEWAAALKVTVPELMKRIGLDVSAPEPRCKVVGVIGDAASVSFDVPSGRTCPAPGTDGEPLEAYEILTADAGLELYSPGYVFVTPRDGFNPELGGRLCVLRFGPARPLGLVAKIVRLWAADRTARVQPWGADKTQDVAGVVSASPVRWQRLM